MRIVAATRNAGKLAAFRSALEPLGHQVLSPREIGLEMDVEETGATFRENATLKAEAIRDACDCIALADDSGLVVDALGGEPGIRSARFGGSGLDDEERTRLLLDRLNHVPTPERTARFVCVLALARPDRDTVLFEGTVDGVIALEARGSNGFGYDPVFVFPAFGRTFGEISARRKDEVSHRGCALQRLIDHLGREDTAVY